MSIDEKPKFLLNVSMDVVPEREALFNTVYEEHIRELLNVPGVVGVRRYRRRPLKMSFEGIIQEFDVEGEPTYSALYELERPEALTSDAWAYYVEKGRWAPEIRPFVRNRRRTMHELISEQCK